VSGREVISPQAHEGRGEETAGALCSVHGRTDTGSGRSELAYDELGKQKLPSFYGSVLKIHLPQQRFKSKIVFDILQHWIVFDGE
jgi:hypothetical protein